MSAFVKAVASTSAPAARARTSEPLRRGAQVDRFVIVDLVGTGTTGAVFAACDPMLDRKIALKLLHAASHAGDLPLRKARLLREALGFELVGEGRAQPPAEPGRSGSGSGCGSGSGVPSPYSSIGKVRGNPAASRSSGPSETSPSASTV